MSRKKGKSKAAARGKATGKAKGKGKGKNNAHSATHTSTLPPFLFYGAHEGTYVPSAPLGLSFNLMTVPIDMAPRFSLADEARWMTKHRTLAFESSRKLRHSPVQFVSAGFLQGTIRERIPAAISVKSASQSTSPAPPLSPPLSDNTDAVAHMTIRSRSPSLSLSEGSSNADQVVFTGRGRKDAPILPQAVSAMSSTPSADVTQLSSVINKTDASIQAGIGWDNVLPKSQKPDADTETDTDTDSIVQDQFIKRRSGRPAWEGTVTPWQHRSKPGIGWQPLQQHHGLDSFSHNDDDDDDGDNGDNDDDDVSQHAAAMEDYMQNADELDFAGNVTQMFAFSHRDMDLGDSHNMGWESASEIQEENPETAWRRMADWDNLPHLDELSTSSDMMDTVVRILSKRTRKSGLHYLCVYEGSVPDDACWLPSTFLTSPSEKQLIQTFEEESLRCKGLKSKDSDEKRIECAGYEIDDAAIARLLQEQEELVLDSDDLLLPEEDSIFDDITGDLRILNRNRQARLRNNQERTFPSASAMVDALRMDPYDGFDIMDTERPSLKIKKKARRGKMPPEIEDSEFNQELQKAWETDRVKKRVKKAERELLRQQGLLGRGKGSSDLRAKYQTGIHMREVVDEICEFLLGDTDSYVPSSTSRL